MTGPASSSDAPVRQAGTRARSGNAMLRTRAALLDAAAASIADQGVRRTTMSDLAARGGVAKATLYNHFRTKDDVLRALVDAQVAALGEACVAAAAEAGLPAALELAAAALAADPALRRVAVDEPALLLPLVAPGETRGWAGARTAVVVVLSAAGAPSGPAAVDALLRWLVTQLLWPATPDQARLGAALLAGLGETVEPSVPEVEVPVDPVPVVEAVAVEAVPAPSGVGWPG